MSSEAVLDVGTQEAIAIDRSKGDFFYPEAHRFDAGRGLSSATIDYICDVKDDPEWVRSAWPGGTIHPRSWLAPVRTW